MVHPRLSNDLYQSPMRFILELLQNADDSDYDLNSEPVFKIFYRNRTIRFDTNEAGFSKSDVEALCSIGGSSKNKPSQPKRSIGEKGIGFKSVFGVSEAVFVASGEYSFKLSTSESFDMLAPAWCSFPDQRHPGFTSILLQLKPQFSSEKLIRELMDIDGRLLMFLQNIKRLEIGIGSNSNGDSNVHKITIERREEHYHGHELRVIGQGKSCSSYMMFRHRVSQMPEEDKRKGYTDTEIILAFPADYRCAEPSIPLLERPNNVYSFLPIRDFGFKASKHSNLVDCCRLEA